MTEQKYIASYRTCVQVSPDGWEERTRTMSCSKDNTLEEIFSWCETEAITISIDESSRMKGE